MVTALAADSLALADIDNMIVHRLGESEAMGKSDFEEIDGYIVED